MNDANRESIGLCFESFAHRKKCKIHVAEEAINVMRFLVDFERCEARLGRQECSSALVNDVGVARGVNLEN